MSDKNLAVTVLKDGETFLEGNFGCTDQDYETVLGVLKDVEMDREQAASLLSGYMHARDVGKVTEDMGKIALIAAVYMMSQGETRIEIPLESGEGENNPPRH